MSKKVKIILVNVFVVILMISHHYIPNLACHGCPPQTWEQIFDHWIVYVFLSAVTSFLVWIGYWWDD